MRHRKKTVKLGRTAEHRKALLANQVCSLIEHGRIKTTLAKAKAVRPFAEKMVTLGKKGSLHNRRTAIAYLRQPDMVKRLFEEIAPRSANRPGGYTRIVKLGPRLSDSAPMAFIEWVDLAPAEGGEETPAAASTTTATEPAATPKPEKPAKDPNAPKKPRGDTSSRKHRDKAKRAEVRAHRARSVAARGTRLKSASERSKAKKRSA